jgi:hypothetical protein
MNLEEHCARVAANMRAVAETGTFDGRITPLNQLYLHLCRRLDSHTNTLLIFTRDTGHHTSGWFKNPDYERCLHLSLSPVPTSLWTPRGRDLDRTVRDAWLAAFFGEHVRLLWAESPKSLEGWRVGVWHWRLFCNERWEPVHPRGEVYSTELTEAGWKSWGERQARIITAPGMDPR